MTFFTKLKELSEAMKLNNPYTKGTAKYEAYNDGFRRGVEYQKWKEENK